MSAMLAIRKAIHQRLTTWPGVLAIVPASNILEAPARCDVLPCILIGDVVKMTENLTMGHRHLRQAIDLPVYVQEPGSTCIKAIAGAIYFAARDWCPSLDTGTCVDLRYTTARFMRDDADPTISHGVISLDILVEMELAA